MESQLKKLTDFILDGKLLYEYYSLLNGYVTMTKIIILYFKNNFFLLVFPEVKELFSFWLIQNLT